MIQDFTFETDDPRELRRLLTSVLTILPGTLRIILDEETYSFSFDDGKDYDGYWRNSDIVVNNPDGTFAVARGTTMFGGAPTYAHVATFGKEEKDKAAARACESRVEPKPRHMWLGTVGRYTGKGKVVSATNAVEQLMSLAQDKTHVRRFKESVEEDCSSEGSPGIGWRLNYSGPGDLIHLSMIYIVYGK